MKIKTSELTGAALAWAVSTVEGWPEYSTLQYDAKMQPWITPNGYYNEWVPFNPGENWAQAGPIIEREDIELRGKFDGVFGANMTSPKQHPLRNVRSRFPQAGPTKLIAAMRCYVASKLGDEVDVPEELQ